MSAEFEKYLDTVMEGFDVSTSPATNMGAPFTNGSSDEELDSDGSVITSSLEDEDILRISNEQKQALESMLEQYSSESTGGFDDLTKTIENLLNI